MTDTEQHSRLVKVARIAGLWYLLMAISGVLGFMVYHSQIYTADPQETLNNLNDNEMLARLRLIFEFLIILSQALTAIWFYRLFRNINEWAALATLIWGTVNAVMILISAVAMGVAIETAGATLEIEHQLATIDVLTSIISNAWGVGGLFFGLWLLPMGYIITSSGRMPVWLGRTLILGGIGYLLSTVLNYMGISGSWVGGLTIPATIGEFWMIGYLLLFGIRPADQ